MRLRSIALSCALTGTLGLLALPAAPALAVSGTPAHGARPAGLTAATLTLRGPATVVYGADVVLSGHLALGAGAPPAGTPVTVTRTGPDGATRTCTVPTADGGGFAFTDHHPAKGHYTYAAQFAGGPYATQAGASVRVAVEVVKPAISVSAPVTDNPYGTRVTVTVTLGPTFADRRVALYATPAGQARRLVATGTVDAKGKWYPAYALTRTTTFTAVFAGDGHNAANSASRTLNAYARVTDRVTGYYKTSRSGSGLVYHVFHAVDALTLHATVAPDKHGECLEPETQQYDAAAGWDADTKYGCDKLDGGSHDTAPFSLSRAAGDRYRIRADYLRSPKDAANLSAQGPWVYFIVTK
jgi:hypothetical protein